MEVKHSFCKFTKSKMVKAPPLGKFDFPAFLLNLVDFLLQRSSIEGGGGKYPYP